MTTWYKVTKTGLIEIERSFIKPATGKYKLVTNNQKQAYSLANKLLT